MLAFVSTPYSGWRSPFSIHWRVWASSPWHLPSGFPGLALTPGGPTDSCSVFTLPPHRRRLGLLIVQFTESELLLCHFLSFVLQRGRKTSVLPDTVKGDSLFRECKWWIVLCDLNKKQLKLVCEENLSLSTGSSSKVRPYLEIQGESPLWYSGSFTTWNLTCWHVDFYYQWFISS